MSEEATTSPSSAERDSMPEGNGMLPADVPSPYAHTSRRPASPDRRLAQYWYVDDHTDSFIEAKNHLDMALVLVARLRFSDGEMLELEPITVGPFATVRLSLKERVSGYIDVLEVFRRDDATVARQDRTVARWGDGSRPNSLLGHVELLPIYPADALAEDFSAWVVVEDTSEGIALVHPFRLPPYATAPTLDSVWWRPYPDARVYYALENTSAAPTTVHVALFTGAGTEMPVPSPTFMIPPRGSRLIALHELVPNALPAVGGIRFVCEGDNETTARPILARGMLIDESRGFSSPLWVHGFRGALHSDTPTELHAVGLLFGSATALLPRSKALVHPHLLLRNVSEREIDLTVAIGGRSRSGRCAEFRLPTRRLGPRSTMHLDLEAERRRSHSDIADGVGSLRLSHDGDPTDVVAELLNVDETGDFCLYDRVVNLHSYDATVLTAISFSLREDRRTFLILKNVSAETQRARILVDHDGGDGYEHAVEVESQGLAVVDLGRLRATRVADQFGRRLPLDVTSGGCVILSSSPGGFLVSDPTFLSPPSTPLPGQARLDADGFSCVDITGTGGVGGGSGGGGGPQQPSPYRYARNPLGKACKVTDGFRAGHRALDFQYRDEKTPKGAKVRALEGGIVTGVRRNLGPSPDGFDCRANGVIVKGRDGYTLYHHVKPRSDLKQGKPTKIAPGELLGELDLSGCTEGDPSNPYHLHVERLQGVKDQFDGTFQDLVGGQFKRLNFTTKGCK